jgi:hypothetical protein
MATYEIEMSPISVKLLLKAFGSCQRQAELIRLSPYLIGPTKTFAGLRLSSIDNAGVCITSFQFDSVFFTGVRRTAVSSDPDFDALLNSKAVTKGFKGVSSTRITKLDMKLSGESLCLTFWWKNGITTLRHIPTSTQAEGSPTVPDDLPSPSESVEYVSFLTTPKYMGGLLELVPDSSALWALSLSHQADENVTKGSVLYITNATIGVQDSSSVVGLTISQAELTRNNSYIRDANFPIGYTMKVPLAELRGIVSLLCDDALRDDFSLTFGFTKFDGPFGQGKKLLVVQAAPKASSSQLAFSFSLWFKGSPVPETRDYEDNVQLEDLNLDDIDPQQFLGNTPFIISSSVSTAQ